MNIGVCDDDVVMVDLIHNIVKNFFVERNIPCSLFKYFRGEEVLAAEQTPDLVFLDIDMPGIGGMETAKEIQRLDMAKKPYICFLSSHKEEIQNAFKVKAFRFIYTA